MPDLDPLLIKKLQAAYNESTPEEQNVFAEVVNTVLQEEAKKDTVAEAPKKEAAAIVETEPTIEPVVETVPTVEVPKKEDVVRFKDLAKIDSDNEAPIKKPGGVRKVYGYLSDFEIINLVHKNGMINPFIDYYHDKNKIPFGLSDYGYTVRLAPSYISLNEADEDILDPKGSPSLSISKAEKSEIVLSPGEVIMGMSLETLKLPDNIIGEMHNTSNYCRFGIANFFWPIPNKMEGRLTFMIKNMNSQKSVVLYSGEGIVEIRFIRPFSMNKETYNRVMGK